MRSIRVTGKIDEKDRLILDEPLDIIKPQRVEIDIIFLDDDLEDYRELTKNEIIEGIREGLHECSIGNTTPVSELWDDLMIQTTAEIDEGGQLILDKPLKKTKPQYVDVTIWFDKNRQAPAQVSEDLPQAACETSVTELTVAQE
jgi:hypothetical protein